MGAKEWKDLKAKQKQKLSEVMFSVVCAHYKEHGQMPAPRRYIRRYKRSGHPALVAVAVPVPPVSPFSVSGQPA